MWKKISWFTVGLIIPLSVNIQKISAHGAKIDYQTTSAIEIHSKYDNGQPMNEAQVIIYAPDNPSQPWLKGMTDENGKFIFTPDYDLTGNWTVKVRSAGHGSLINIPIQPISTTETTKNNNNSPQASASIVGNQGKDSEEVSSPMLTQADTNNTTPDIFRKLLMAATGVWGFVGTALFFSRQKD